MDEPVDISYSIIWLIEIDILFVKTIYRDGIFPVSFSVRHDILCGKWYRDRISKIHARRYVYIDRSSFTTGVQFECTWRELIK